MTDAALVAKKLSQIETYVGDLRRLARPDALEADLRRTGVTEHAELVRGLLPLLFSVPSAPPVLRVPRAGALGP